MSSLSALSLSRLSLSELSRREVIGAAGLAGLGLVAGSTPALAATKTETVPDSAIGTQLFTCTVATLVAMPVALELIATIGYQIVEHAGYPTAVNAQTFRSELDASGLRCTSGHTDIPHPYNDATWKTALENANIVGQSYIVCPSKSGLSTVAHWKAYADSLNKAGAAAKAAGLRSIGHHNHTGEWQPLPGSKLRPVDVLLQNTDPALVHLEMDIGWAYAALGSVEKVQAELRRYPARIRQFHVKDIVNDAPVLPGQGEIGKEGFAKIFGTAKETRQPITDYLIEDDTALVTCADAELTGYQLLHGMTYTWQAPESRTRSGGSGGSGSGGSGSSSGGGSGGSLAATGGALTGVGTLGLAALAGAVLARRRRSTTII
ncbi:MAG: sugar phosphate isomerase/epimerase family protein [Mycobacteriales bacterium]